MARKPGKPSKLINEELKERFLNALRMGSNIEAACQWAGIQSTTYCEWMRRGRGESPRGRKPTEEYAQFARDVEQAIAEAEMRLLTRINNASRDNPQNWRAAAWIMSRRWPENWSETYKVEQEVQKRVEGQSKEILDRLEAILSPDEYQKVLLAFAGGDRPPTAEPVAPFEDGDRE